MENLDLSKKFKQSVLGFGLVYLFSCSAFAGGFGCNIGTEIASERCLKLLEIATNNASVHDANMLGMPESYDWVHKARPGRWNNKGSANQVEGWFNAYFVTHSPRRNATLQLRNYAVWVYSASRGWIQIQNDTFYGRNFDPDLQKNNSTAAPNYSNVNGVRTLEVEYPKTFQAWGDPTPGLDLELPADYLATLVLVEARSANSDSLLLGVGADFYDHGKYLGDLGIGKFSYVSRDWKLFGFTTATVAQLSTF